MHVKRYQAASIKDAMSLVKKDLGTDAFIVSTEKISPGPGGAGGEWFEVTAIPANQGRAIQEESRRERQAEAPAQPPPPRARLEVLDDSASGESLKDLFSLLGHREDMVELLLSDPEATRIYVALIRLGISSVRARDLLEKAGSMGASVMDGRELWRQVTNLILDRMDFMDPFAREGQTVAAFVGPTGVGKTTTVAKLAASLALSRKKSVGLLSIDNYRIGAVEQLKTYASILGLPCHQAFNQKDLEFALRRLGDKDVVLIDTAGQSQYDAARMREMDALLGGQAQIDAHLVLSTVTCETELQEAAARFGQLQCKSYIFTKTDETRKRGAIVNQIAKQPMPISFISTGQRVPEDIFAANRESVWSLLFGKAQGLFEGRQAGQRKNAMGLSV